MSIIRPAKPQLNILLLAVLTLALLLLAYHQGVTIQELWQFLTAKQGEYLFFVGAILLAIECLKRRRWVCCLCFFSLAWIWVLTYESAANWIQTLGADSFAETKNFDWDEAKFYLRTVSDNIEWTLSFDQLLIYTCIIALIYVVLQHLHKLSHNKISLCIILSSAILLISASIHYAYKGPIALFLKNSEVYLSVKNNFDHAPPVFTFKNQGLKLVVYIGESTSIMNMGIYGYMRETTPRLSQLYDEDGNLLLFHNIFSTHTHTTPSLLEAFSFGLDENENWLPIEQRQRISLIDILHTADIKTTLISNQGMTGIYNLASSVLFSNAEKKFSTESRMLGNQYMDIKKPLDHLHFQQEFIPTIDKMPLNKSELVILHSYAGHHLDINNISKEFQNPIDDRLQDLQPKAIIGKRNKRIVEELERYDSIIRYIDHTVSSTIDSIKQSPQPSIFIYFSDHGDAVFTGLAHDSSRFTHEMARIPFLMYFNEQAKHTYPELYKKYKLLSEGRKIATLAQLPDTIIDLLDGQSVNKTSLISNAEIGVDTKHRPILVRETPEGITYVSLGEVPPPPKQSHLLHHKFIDRTDNITRVFTATNFNQPKKAETCYHRSNTIGKALRGRLVANCLETDLVVGEDGSLNIHHSSTQNVGLPLSDIVDIVNKNNLALWIDGKNISDKKNCLILADYLKTSKLDKSSTLIEFPNDIPLTDPVLLNCVKSLRDMGFRTSYYTHTGHMKKCSNALQMNKQIHDNESCGLVESQLTSIYDTNAFSDYSFDIAGLRVMEHMDVAKKLDWNTWNVEPIQMPHIEPDRFGMIILKNDDPNNR